MATGGLVNKDPISFLHEPNLVACLTTFFYDWFFFLELNPNFISGLHSLCNLVPANLFNCIFYSSPHLSLAKSLLSPCGLDTVVYSGRNILPWALPMPSHSLGLSSEAFFESSLYPKEILQDLCNIAQFINPEFRRICISSVTIIDHFWNQWLILTGFVAIWVVKDVLKTLFAVQCACPVSW